MNVCVDAAEGLSMNEVVEMGGIGSEAPQMGSLLKSPYLGSAAWADSADKLTPSPSRRVGAELLAGHADSGEIRKRCGLFL